MIRQARPFSSSFKDWDSKASSFNNLLEEQVKCIFKNNWLTNLRFFHEFTNLQYSVMNLKNSAIL